MTPSIVEIKDLSFRYNGQNVLEDVNLDVRKGDFVAMIGPNGGGKTTLLKLMLGLLEPDRGRIRILGKTTESASHHIGYVPQDVHINRSFPITALDIVLMGKLGPKKWWARRRSSVHQEALAALERLEIASHANKKIGELSGGQLQRVFIARALVTDPLLLLLDEPTASIDTKGQAEFFRLLKELNRDVTILVVSHDLLAVSAHVKAIACVNKHVHYHDEAQITGEMLESMYPCAGEEVCPVELLVQGFPHRIPEIP